MERLFTTPGQHIQVFTYAANTRSIHRHDQSEGSEFLDDAIRMSDVDPGRMASPETWERSPATGWRDLPSADNS